MYSKILKDTLRLYDKLPVIIPEKGFLVGFAREFWCPYSDAFRNDNHHYPMGTTFLKYGIKGIARKARRNVSPSKSKMENELLEGIAIVYDKISEYFSKYVASLDELIQKAAEEEKPRLLSIRNNMYVLANKKPQTFTQGIQLYYFMWKLRGLFSFTGDLGRLDYHLRYLYENDVNNNNVSEKEILDVICEFYEKLNQNNSGDTLINISIGGLNPDGTDSGSRLSALFLKATTIVQKTEPHINVRLNEHSREDVIDEMLNVQYLGHGQGSAYFDKNVIPALRSKGIRKKAACSYTNDGCTEIMCDGYSGIDFNHMDAVAVLEAALNNGKYIKRDYFRPIKYYHKDFPANYYVPDIEYGYESGIVEDCKTFKELYNCYLKQLRFQVENRATQLLSLYKNRKRHGLTSLFLSGTFERVLNTGKDLMRGGFAYDYYQMFSGSIPTVADSLCAIKKAVFEEKRYTISQLKEATGNNFEGNEVMRQILLNYPKFGNDIDEVDEIASDIVKHFCKYLDEFYKKHKFRIFPCLLGWRFIEEAHGIAATCDGRKYGASIAEHYCATPGKATNGPTAIINSIGKAPCHEAAGVVAVHISLPRKLAETKQESKDVLKTLLKSAEEKGLLMVNISIYDKEKLLQAQKFPEENQDVIVRVWGYSAKFVDLCKEMQDNVISRIEVNGQ